MSSIFLLLCAAHWVFLYFKWWWLVQMGYRKDLLARPWQSVARPGCGMAARTTLSKSREWCASSLGHRVPPLALPFVTRCGLSLPAIALAGGR